MAESDNLKRLLTEAEAYVMPHITAPGADATRVALWRRTRRRGLAVALIAVAVSLGVTVSTLSHHDTPTQVIPSSSPNPEPTPEATSTPSMPAQAPSSASCQIKLTWDTNNTALQQPGGTARVGVTYDSELCGQRLTVFWQAFWHNGSNYDEIGTQTFYLDANKRSITTTLPIAAYCGQDKRVWWAAGDMPREMSYAENSSPYLKWSNHAWWRVLDYQVGTWPCPTTSP